jgi:hypothetical protein
MGSHGTGWLMEWTRREESTGWWLFAAAVTGTGTRNGVRGLMGLLIRAGNERTDVGLEGLLVTIRFHCGHGTRWEKNNPMR